MTIDMYRLATDGLFVLAFLLLGLSLTVIVSPALAGRKMIEKAIMPASVMVLLPAGSLFRNAIRLEDMPMGIGSAYVDLGLLVMFVLVIFFSAFASARRQIKACKGERTA